MTFTKREQMGLDFVRGHRAPALPSPPPLSTREKSLGGRALLHVRRYRPPSWFTPSGAAKKLKRLEKLGLPSMLGWKMVTLTLDRDLFGGDPLAGFLAARKRLVRFIRDLRDAGLIGKIRWGRKMEFHKDGWPHWHLMLEYRDKWTVEEMQRIAEIWRLGRVNVVSIKTREFVYEFKYLSKSVGSDGEQNLPGWFANFYSKKDGEKPDSFGRIRIWQTSRGFYKSKTPPPKEQPAGKKSSYFPVTPSEILDRMERGVQVVARKASGGYAASAVILLSIGLGQMWSMIGWDVVAGRGAWLAVDNFLVRPELVETTEKWKVRNLQKMTGLTKRRAEMLAGRDWRRC